MSHALTDWCHTTKGGCRLRPRQEDVMPWYGWIAIGCVVALVCMGLWWVAVLYDLWTRS